MANSNQPQKGLFGNTNPQTSLFGNNNSQPSPFGTNQPASLFGNPTKSGSLFSPAPPTTQQSSLFGVPAPTAVPLGSFSTTGTGFAGFGAQPASKKEDDTKKEELAPKLSEKKEQIKQAGFIGFGAGGSLFGKSSGPSVSSGGLFSSKESQGEKKREAPPTPAEPPKVQDGGMFGKKQDQPNFGSGGLFGKTDSTAGTSGPTIFSGFGKKDEKQESKDQTVSGLLNAKEKTKENPRLFSESLFTSSSGNPNPLFAPKKPEEANNKGTEGSNSPTVILGAAVKVPKEAISEPATKVNPIIPQQSLFGKPTDSNQISQKGSLFSSQEQKSASLGSLFGQKSEVPPEVKTDKSASSKSKDGLNSEPGLTGNFSFANKESNQKKQAPPEKKQEGKGQPLLFGQSMFTTKEKEVSKQSVTPSAPQEQSSQSQPQSRAEKLGVQSQPKPSELREFAPSNVDQKQRVFNFPEKSTEARTGTITTTDLTEKAKISEMSSSKMTESVLIPDKKLQDSKIPGQITRQKSQTQPYLSTIRPRAIAQKVFIDFKTLKEEERSQTFEVYLSQKKADIIQSIKIYFSLGDGSKKEAEKSQKEKDMFYGDLSVLLLRVLNIDSSHLAVLQGFVRRVMMEQKYQEKMFVGDQLARQFFRHHAIYWQDYSGRYQLNQNSSQLKHLVEKMMHKWYSDKINYLNFLFSCPDLVRPKEDLFSFLFRTLLKLQQPRQETQEIILGSQVRDYNRVLTQKMVQLLEYYNKKLGRSYRLLGDEAEKVVIGTLDLIENINNETVISAYLRIVLTALNLHHHDKLSNQLFRALRETKSMALLPLRVITAKIKEGRLEFAPGPKDLYRFVRGDEWADWLDLYLHSNQRQLLELQADEPSYLVESLSSLSGMVLIEHLMGAKKGIFKFFQLLRQENMVQLYYRVLQACLYNQQSIKEVDQFYFKKVYFNFEYQEIVQYVVNFHQNLELEPHKRPNEEAIFRTLPQKLSLLAKILQIEPERLFDLEKYIFYPDFNPNKKFRFGPGAEHTQREGHKMVHVFIDLVKISSLKALAPKVQADCFRVLTALLKSRRTEPVVVAAISISEPCFGSKGETNSELATAMGEFLEHVVCCNYLSQLMIGEGGTTQQRMKAELFYPFRYNNTEFTKLLSCQEEQLPQSFSLSWVHQLFLAASKQKFNPHLLSKLLSKLYIHPSSVKEEEEEGLQGDFGIRRFRKAERKVPLIFEMIVSLANNFSIWEEINKALEFRVTREEGKFVLVNRQGQGEVMQSYKYLFATLKLLRIILSLNEMLLNRQERCPDHFVIKALSSMSILNRIQISAVLSSQSQKGNLLLSLLACIQPQQPLHNDSQKVVVWESEQEEEDSTRSQLTLNFFRNQASSLDFDQISDFLKSSCSRYCENQDNLTTLALSNITALLKTCSECSLEYSLLRCWELGQEEKIQLKVDVVSRITQTLTDYLTNEEFSSIRYKLFQFIYDLKYNLGGNRYNHSLSDSLFSKLFRVYKPSRADIKLDRVLLGYFSREIKEEREQCEASTEQTVLRVLSNFELRESILQGGHVLKDCKQIGEMLLRYHKKQYSLLNFNQLERLIEQKTLTDIVDTLTAVNHCVSILTNQLVSKRYSVTLSRALQELGRLIAEKNLLLLQNDLPFEHKVSPLTPEQITARLEFPKLFLRDPLELFLSQSKTLSQKGDIQTIQKNNFIEWFMQAIYQLSNSISTYLQLALTIDKNFYSNNPVQIGSSRQDLAAKDLFCHLSLGKLSLSAIDLFGRSEQDALGVVQLIAQNTLSRLLYLDQLLGETSDSIEKDHYLLGLKVLGLTLEWMRSRRGQGSAEMVRRISRNYKCLLPRKGIMSREQLKVLQSYLSCGDTVPNHVKYDIHHHCAVLLNKHSSSRKEPSSIQQESELGQVIQQVFSIFMVCPPASNETNLLDNIIAIWSQEGNDKFFFNQSRLIIELCHSYPEEMAKLKLLSRLEALDSARTFESRYEDQQRRPDSIAWLWTVKVATSLLTSSASTLPLKEGDTFFIKNRTRIYKILEGSELKVTRAYLEDLEAVLELIIALFSHALWVSANRTAVEEITYLMSNQLLRWLVKAVQGPGGTPVSHNEKVLSQIGASGAVEEGDGEDYRSDNLESLFSYEIKIKLNYCIRYYCMAMEKAFKLSLFVQKYFSECVMGSSRYLTSFWDSFNKSIVVLLNYSLARLDFWLKNRLTTQILALLNDCYNAPYTFFDNGYLTTVIDLPQSEGEVVEDHYLVAYLLAELAVVHFLKQKVYAAKYSTLMASQGQKFSRRLKDHINKAREVGKKIGFSTYLVGEDHFQKLADVLDCRHQN